MIVVSCWINSKPIEFIKCQELKAIGLICDYAIFWKRRINIVILVFSLTNMLTH